MECIFLLRIEDKNMSNISHIGTPFPKDLRPESFYINLPSDMLSRKKPYSFRMSLTEEESIKRVSRFYNNTFTSKYNVYETISLPKVSKFRCNEFEIKNSSEFQKGYDTNQYYERYAFSFSTSIPKILSQIVYNTVLNECQDIQVHSGQGNNIKE